MQMEDDLAAMAGEKDAQKKFHMLNLLSGDMRQPVVFPS